MSIGADIGTCFLVSARQDSNNQLQIKTMRDAFLDMDNDPTVKNLLKMSKIDFVESEDKLYLIGDPAVTMANIFKREARRPLSKGVLAPGELEAERILLLLLENILGKAKVQGETCFYSVPAAPTDRDIDVVYHQAMFSKLIGTLGYTPVALNEAAAIVYSNCGKEMFSGIAISCLTPGQKVITKRGLINIEDIKEGDDVLSKDGVWQTCVPTSREYSGKVYSLGAYGNGKVEVTGNHQIWVNRDDLWQYVSAENLLEGDLVIQPWPNFKFDQESKFICYDERITSSKDTKTVSLSVSSELFELIGYFLGDGCIEYCGGTAGEGSGVGFTFQENDRHNIDRVSSLVKSIFDKDVAEYPHGENAIRIKFYSKGFSKWLQDKCYTDSKEKKVPWDIAKLNDSNIRFLLKGLIESDGNYNDDHVGFDNTSPNLAQFVYLAMHRLNLAPSMSVRDPRSGGDVGGRIIIGQKESFLINSTGIEARNYVAWLKNPQPAARKTASYGGTVAKINKIEVRDYSGTVYDVHIVSGDPSFCVPGFAVHNCGAGMVNVCLMYQTMIGMAFSVSRSGDWIDESASKAVGTTASRIQAIKERGVDLLDPVTGDPRNVREREAISIYYKSMALYALEAIKTEFNKRRGTIDLPNAIPMIISGGTAKATNFKEFFEQAFNTVKDKFPIPISEIRMATDPLNAVAQGLLVAAMNYDEGNK